MSKLDADIIIVGAGMAGSIAAYLLGRQGLRVTLIDRKAECPPVFRAEKLEPDQVELLKKFGLLDARRPLAEPIGEILCYEEGVLTQQDTVEQYGIRYHDTVNCIRAFAIENADFHNERVIDIRFSAEQQEVVLQSDEVLTAKWVVLACGYKAGLLSKLGVDIKSLPGMRSLSFGFDIAPLHGGAFPFNGFNYHLNAGQSGVDYVTVFKIGDVMRVNIFTQLTAREPLIKAFLAAPYEQMQALFPGLLDYTGEFKIISKVESFVTEYYQSCPSAAAGMVVVGDAYQSVSPTTGTGLSKVFNDVDVLCNVCIPKWLETEGGYADKVKGYYASVQKQSADKASRGSWQYYQNKYHAKNGIGYLLRRLRLVGILNRLKHLWYKS